MKLNKKKSLLNNKVNFFVKILLFMVVILPVFSPLVANAQEPIMDIKTKIEQNIEDKKTKQQEETDEVRDTRAGATSSKAKNVVYGESGGSEDNGVGTIDVDTTTISNFEYKINAITHEVIVRFNIDASKLSLADDYTFAMNVKDDTGNIVTIEEGNLNGGSVQNLGTGASGTYDIEVATGSLEAHNMDRDGNYNIYFTNTDFTDTSIIDIVEIEKTATKVDSVNIEVPQTLLSDGVIYSLVGDSVNAPTDTDNISNKDKVEPSTTLGYGIYEMESVGYEEANPTSTDWTSDDLTLAKYDHVIRPTDGNYLVAKDIDGEVTDSAVGNTDADNLGGFGLDGYRPIGQVIGTTNGTDSVAFTGSVSGNVDEILGETQDNTYISNMHINTPGISNVGLISVADGVSISDLGIIDPLITGKDQVGSIVGSINGTETSKLTNVYALETTNDSVATVYDINGQGSVGGMVGLVKGPLEITSGSRFEGEVPGIDLTSSLLTQPNEWEPDKDGYKTFTTVDVYGADSFSGVGGIVGTVDNGTVNFIADKVYSKSWVSGYQKVGGIVGIITDTGTVSNAYYSAEAADDYTYPLETRRVGTDGGNEGFASGIVGMAYSNVSIRNVYNSTNITGSWRVAGITGAGSNTVTIENAINSGHIKSTSYYDGNGALEYKDSFTAGIANSNPIAPPLESAIPIVKNTINIGDVDAEGSNPGGIVTGREAFNGTTASNVHIENAINVGDIRGMYGVAATNPYQSISSIGLVNNLNSQKNVYNIGNVYSCIGGMCTQTTDMSSTSGDFYEVMPSTIGDANWWSGTLVDSEDYDGDSDITETWGLRLDDNWNIKAGDASATTSASDTCAADGNDESCDNDLGQVNRKFYPTVKEINVDGTVSDEEVPEQTNIEMPEVEYDIAVNNYKIDSQSLNIYLSMTMSEKTRTDKGKINIYEGDYTGTNLPGAINYGLDYDIVIGDSIFTIPGSSIKYDIKANQDYTISVLDPSNNEVERLVIHIPSQYVDNKGTPLYGKDDIIYSMVGDSVNENTFVSATKMTDTAVSKPTGSGVNADNVYGVYELESIGYEEANDVSSAISTQKADWSANDLTLTKYDHVIRPLDGNYLIMNDIDASVTDATIGNTNADNLGGFGTDGYRPIGHIIGDIDGTNILSFTGNISGDVDDICGISNCRDTSGVVDKSGIENSVITNLYVNNPSLNFVGLVGKTEGAKIDNLGMIDPYMQGYQSVGAIAGLILFDTELLNVYALETINDITPDIISTASKAGGLVGQGNTVTIRSDSRFEGEIPGIDLSLDSQPSNMPDKDGYKTFNTLDVQASGYTAGGIGGSFLTTTIENVYNKGNVVNLVDNAGGISGEAKGLNITNAYNTGHIYGPGATAAGIFANSNASTGVTNEVKNVYNTGLIESGKLATGIVADYTNTNITNAINKGEVKGIDGVTSSLQVSGIVGNIEDTEDTVTHLTNVINMGKINANDASEGVSGTYTKVAGIVSDGASLTSDFTITNGLNVGELTSKNPYMMYSISENSGITVVNTYALEGVNDSTSDLTVVLPGEFAYITKEDLNNTLWWKGALVDSGDYDGDSDITETWGLGLDDNWNIEAGDAIATTSNTDGVTCDGDESCDNDLGQVNRKFYPTVKEINTDGSVSDEEVPEQTNIKMPQTPYDVAVNNYKINAMTLDIYLSMTVNERVRAAEGDINIYEGDQSTTNPLPAIDYAVHYNLNPGDREVTIPGTSVAYDMKSDTTYTINVLDPQGSEVERLVIHTPKQVKQDYDRNHNGIIEDMEKNLVFALIGDNVNQNTYVSSTTVTDTAVSKPTGSGVNSDGVYGVYELESIGYEDSNIKGGNSTSPVTWDINDLTLTKYDHVIRPIDGNYIVSNDVDATVVYEGTSQTLDKNGGFSSDSNGDADNIINVADTNDGFRSIGETIGYNTPTIFTGTLIGLPDTEILNIYLNDSSKRNFGMIDDNNGVVDGINLTSNNATSEIIGNMYVGALVGRNEGSIYNSSSMLNTNGSMTGSLVGTNTGMIYNSYATGDVSGSNVGGLAGGNYGSIYNSYATGDVVGYVSVGGIVGVNCGTLSDSYATGDVTGNIITDYGSFIGGLVGQNDNASQTGKINNSYATGNIVVNSTYSTQVDVGGLAAEDGQGATIYNSYATGNITVNAPNALVGALVGRYEYGDSVGSLVSNSYAYETQKINGVPVDPTQILGEDPTYNNIATYEQLSNTDGDSITDWYLDTLGWDTSTLENDSSMYWTSPWIYGTGSDVGKICHPHNYTVDQDGYIPNQPCVPINKKPTPGIVNNFKIDATTLNVYLQMASSGSFDITVTDVSSGSSITNNLTTATVGGVGNIITLSALDFGFEQDKSYNIVSLPDTNFTIHMPKQKVVDGVTYALVGDDVNEETDEDGVFTSSKVSPATAPISQLPDTNKAYGIYELESIGYEASNGGINTLSTDKVSADFELPVIVGEDGELKEATAEEKEQIKNNQKYVETDTQYFLPQWNGNDLTLAKYDHVIRPLNGNYMIANSVDASPTYNSRNVLDTAGGFASDYDGDGVASDADDEFDGFRPIGKQNSDDMIEEFTGRLIGDPTKDIVIEDLYIHLDDDEYHDIWDIDETTLYRSYIGLIGITNESAIVANFGITSDLGSGTTTSYVDGVYDSGVVAGYNHGTIANVYTDATATGQNTAGGITGVNYGTINHCFSQGKVSDYGAGGIAGVTYPEPYQRIIDSYSTGVFTGRYTGGIVGSDYGLDSDDSMIQNVYALKTKDSASSVSGALVGDYCETKIYNALYRGIATDKDGGTCGSRVYNSYNMSSLTSGQLLDPSWYSTTLAWNATGVDGSPGYDWLVDSTSGTEICYPKLYKDETYLGSFSATNYGLIPNQECNGLASTKEITETIEKIDSTSSKSNVNISSQQKSIQLKNEVMSNSEQNDELNIEELEDSTAVNLSSL